MRLNFIFSIQNVFFHILCLCIRFIDCFTHNICAYHYPIQARSGTLLLFLIFETYFFYEILDVSFKPC